MQAPREHGDERRRTVIWQYIRAPRPGTIRHRQDGDLKLRDAGRQFRSRALVIDPAHPIRLRMIDRIPLMPDPLARALVGFPEEFLVRFDHPAEVGSAASAEGANGIWVERQEPGMRNFFGSGWFLNQSGSSPLPDQVWRGLSGFR